MNSEEEYDAEELFGHITCDKHVKLDVITIGQMAVLMAMQGLCASGLRPSNVAAEAIRIANETIDLMNGTTK